MARSAADATDTSDVLDLLARIGRVGVQSREWQQGLLAILSELCEYARRPIAHAYLVSGEGIVTSPTWYLRDEDRFAVFRERWEAYSAEHGRELVDHFLATGEAILSDRLRIDESASELAAAAGLYGVVTMSVPAGDLEIAAVLEVFAEETDRPDPRIVRVLEVASSQISQLVERHRMLERVRMSDERFETLCQGIEDAVMLLEMDGRIVSANAAATRLTGYSSDELATMNASTLLASEYHDVSRSQMARKLAGLAKYTRYESVLIDRSGRRAPVTVTSSLVQHDERGTVACVVCREAGERQRAELALQESEERFRRTFESAPIGMAVANMDRRVLMVNEALCTFLGVTRDVLLDRPAGTMADDSPPFEEVRRLVAGEISWFQTERRFRREDGRVVWGLVSVSLVRSADGAPTLFISQVQDITDRKHAELLDAGRSRATPLSPREAEVLGLLARGLSGTQIGKQLAIGEETVQTHVRRAMKKLDAKTRTQAVASATRLGLLDEGYEPPTSFS